MAAKMAAKLTQQDFTRVGNTTSASEKNFYFWKYVKTRF